MKNIDIHLSQPASQPASQPDTHSPTISENTTLLSATPLDATVHHRRHRHHGVDHRKDGDTRRAGIGVNRAGEPDTAMRFTQMQMQSKIGRSLELVAVKKAQQAASSREQGAGSSSTSLRSAFTHRT